MKSENARTELPFQSMTEADLTTPALVVDLPRLEQNIHEAAAVCRHGRVSLRPHTKTHKCIEIAWLQRQAGAVGICVQTTKEAEVFAQAGFDDIFLARPPVQPRELERLAILAKTIRLRIAVDSLIGVNGIAAACRRVHATADVRVEIDAGLGRSGVCDRTALEALWTAIDDHRELRFDGVFGYEGQVYLAENLNDLSQRVDAALSRVLDLSNWLRKHTGEDFTVSMGATPSYRLLAETIPALELRPGNYVFGDAKLAPLIGFERCAQSVLATVIGRPSENRCILDCGMKSIAAELHMTGMLRRTSYGHIVEYPDAVIGSLSEEHGMVDLSARGHKPQIGERVHVIANHACTTTNLHARIFAVRDGTIEHIWTVAPRGSWD